MSSSSSSAVSTVRANYGAPTNWKSAQMQNHIKKRYRAERRFRLIGLTALLFAISFLLFLLTVIISNGWSGFRTTEIRLDVTYSETSLGLSKADLQTPGGRQRLENADYGLLGTDALIAKFPKITDRDAQAQLAELLSPAATSIIRDHLISNPSLLGQKISLWLPAATDIDMLRKGNISRALPETQRGVSDNVVSYYDTLAQQKDIRTVFNTRFLSGADSRDPEIAAVWGATVGSLLTLAVTLLLSFPIGVLSAVYLEEYAPKNALTDFIEVNINNLAAVPSIIFGLLGLAVFLGAFGMGRSSPVVGGLTLALMTLPTIVIAARVSIKAVPPSVRDAARGIGASQLQVVFHHVVPLALPGILTGTIIGMARALGETAPLLMVGMRAFIADVPKSFSDPATVLPVQVFLWSDSVERGFVEKTSAAIIVLLFVLMLMNGCAIVLRQKFERRW